MSDTQARLGLAIGGAAVGSFFGVPGLGLAIGSIAGSLLFPGPDPPPTLGPQLGDLQVQVSAYGNPMPHLFGTVRVAGNIIWNSNIREIAHKQSSSGGGKGGAPKQESISFTYEVDLQISLCHHLIDGIGRVWANDQLFYDFSNPPHAKGLNAKIYFGTDTQTPDPLIEADKGVGNVPAYRGQAYIMLRKLDLTPFNNGIPTFHFEVHANGDPTIPISEVIDSPTGGGNGRITIDPDTGLIWATRGLTDHVDVYQCNNGLERVCSHEGVLDPFGVSYQPSFVAVSVDLLGTVTTKTIPPKMWVSSGMPDALGGETKAFATDASCRVLETIPDPFNGSIFCWAGQCIVDLSSINLAGPVIGEGPTLMIGVTNGACTGIQVHGLNELAPGVGFPSPSGLDTSWNTLGLRYVADWISMDDGVACVDTDGNLVRMKGGSVTAHVRALLSWISLRNSVTWDPEEEMIYTKINFSLSSDGRIAKWSKDLVMQWEFDYKIEGDAFNPDRIRYHQGVGDVWVVGRVTGGQNHAKRINKESGGFLDDFIIGTSNALDDFQPFPGAPFAVATRFNADGSVIKFPLGQGAVAQAPTLAQVVTDIVELTETLTAADIDVSLLTPYTVRGYSLSKRQPVRAALQPLMQTYFFDAVESDDKIKFVPRGASPVATIPSSDMNARRNVGDPGQTIEQVRTQENELPTSLDLRFISHDTDYKIGVVQARRLITESQQVRTLDVPIVFTATEARAIVDVLIHNLWFERTKKTFTLSKRYFAFEPTDVVTITTPDQGQINVRLNSVAMSLPGLLDVEASEEDTTVYSGFLTPGAVGLTPQPGLLTTAPVVLIIMDISTLRDLDNNTGVYVVAYAIGGPYEVSSVLQSQDGIVFGAGAVLPNEGNVGFADSLLTWEGSFA